MAAYYDNYETQAERRIDSRKPMFSNIDKVVTTTFTFTEQAVKQILAQYIQETEGKTVDPAKVKSVVTKGYADRNEYAPDTVKFTVEL